MRIALIHAVTVAIEPIRTSFDRLWPEAECINLLDDSLSPDRARDDDLTPVMSRRIEALGRYAQTIGANGILYTCSAFGEAIERVAHDAPFPVLKPNEAMFEDALDAGKNIGMLATFQPSVASMEAEFHEAAARRGTAASIRTICVPEAMAALRAGNERQHNDLLAEQSRQMKDCDAVLLAHFSTSRAAPAVAQVLGRAPLTSPDSAVRKLRARLNA